ncbi:MULTISPECIES: hypothetical protein [unclassified Alteromonas]|uniref:hypothetical protein n=1 Tax=unclassified Alteromonas TaxID=2614992 RepID=UPI0005093EE5|nr:MULTISPECIES: hypothetical protein [unclassified Alteromonas]
MNFDDVIKNMFAERLFDPLAWFAHSRALVGSARISKEQADKLISPLEKSELENVCSLLYGLALENLFKAVWVYQKFGSLSYESPLPNPEFPNQIKTHDLLKLAKLVDSELATKYEMSLKLLTEATTWAGRYPCSIKGDEGTIIRMPSIHNHAEEMYAKHRKIFTISS